MPMKKLGIVAFLLTFVLTIPILFIFSRNTVNANQFILIVSAVLMLVLWTIAYMTLVDPLLRRGMGALFDVHIQWRGPSGSISWTPVEDTGCLFGLFLDLLGYFFIVLWFMPFVAAIGLALWLRH